MNDEYERFSLRSQIKELEKKIKDRESTLQEYESNVIRLRYIEDSILTEDQKNKMTEMKNLWLSIKNKDN